MFSIGIGRGTQNKQGDWLEAFYPCIWLNPPQSLVGAIAGFCDVSAAQGTAELSPDDLAGILAGFEAGADAPVLQALIDSGRTTTLCWMQSDGPIESTPAAYLKLHLLSRCLVRPNEVDLEGIFAQLPNVAWTSQGAFDLGEIDDAILSARLNHQHLEVLSVDKFPKLTNYLIPPGVRIADSARVRLGAYLGQGTTVMHEGFINFNAGAEGPNMVEGRISQGVFVAKGSDLGGSASTAGTLSGGGNEVLSIGEDCLISANAGTGISLGDRCTIEAGLYITPGTVVEVIDENGQSVETLKARELSGHSDLLFIRHSQSGTVQCRTNRHAIALNEALHQHN